MSAATPARACRRSPATLGHLPGLRDAAPARAAPPAPRRHRTAANASSRRPDALPSLRKPPPISDIPEAEKRRIRRSLRDMLRSAILAPSVRGIIFKGVRDIQQVKKASEGREDAGKARLTELSRVWTFPVCLVAYSTFVLAWASELAGSPYPHWVAPTVGFFIGASFAFAHRAATVRLWIAPKTPLNVVVTGGTRGLGRALVREFLLAGDNVYIASRSAKTIREAAAELAGICQRPRQIAGVECDVSSPSDVARLVSLAQDHFEDRCIDVWINNAGVSGTFKSFLEAAPEDIQAVTQTNLRGTLLCTRAAILAMSSQGRRGHIFNMDGAGADGLATPNYAAYGATKAGIAHIMPSVAAECDSQDLEVGVHTLSPGMVLTDLLLAGATTRNKQVFNLFCEHPETAAAFLVPRVRTVAVRSDSMEYIRFLTTLKALLRLLTAPLHLERFFTSTGEARYPQDEQERLLGRMAKRTARVLSNTRQRGQALKVSYAFCLGLAVLVLVGSRDPITLATIFH